MKARLLSEDPRCPNLDLDVNGHPLVLGRSMTAGVQVPDPLVSRRHCTIEAAHGLLVVRDLGSSNGTIVNGQPVADASLFPGDRILLGSTRFVVAYEPEGDPTVIESAGTPEEQLV